MHQIRMASETDYLIVQMIKAPGSKYQKGAMPVGHTITGIGFYGLMKCLTNFGISRLLKSK